MPSFGFGKSVRWRFGSDVCPYWNAITGSAPSNVPRAFWKSLTWTIMLARITGALFMAAGLVCCIGILVPSGKPMGIFGFNGIRIISALAVVHFTVYAYGVRIARGRFAKHLQSNDYRVCFECGYLLTGLSDSCDCPECGAFSSLLETRKRWSVWLNRNISYE